MTLEQINLCERLKRFGFAQEKRMRLYGEEFELTSDPIVQEDDLVFVDAVEKKSKRSTRVRIPLLLINMAKGQRGTA